MTKKGNEEIGEDDLNKAFVDSLLALGGTTGDAFNAITKVADSVSTITTNGTAKEVLNIVSENVSGLPIISLILGICKTTKALHHWNLMRQTEQFLVAFREKRVPKEKLAEYRKKLLENPEKMRDEFGRILFFLEGNVEKEKSENMAKLCAEYINERLGYEQLIEMYDVNARLFVKDIQLLRHIVLGPKPMSVLMYSKYQYDRLIALGLLQSYDEMNGTAMWRIPPTGKPEDYKPTSLGSRFVKIIAS